MWVPKKVEDEWERLLPIIFEIRSDSDEEDAQKRTIDYVIEEYGSPEAKAFHAFCQRVGDENQVLEKDGSYLCDNSGAWIQEWSNFDDGFIRDRHGNMIYYKDGTPVPNIEWPEIIQRLSEEEYGTECED